MSTNDGVLAVHQWLMQREGRSFLSSNNVWCVVKKLSYWGQCDARQGWKLWSIVQLTTKSMYITNLLLTATTHFYPSNFPWHLQRWKTLVKDCSLRRRERTSPCSKERGYKKKKKKISSEGEQNVQKPRLVLSMLIQTGMPPNPWPDWADYAVQAQRPQLSLLAERLWTDPGLKSGTGMHKLIST